MFSTVYIKTNLYTITSSKLFLGFQIFHLQNKALCVVKAGNTWSGNFAGKIQTAF